MKYVKILIQPIEMKADLEDPDTLQQDLYEKLTAMVESETLAYEVLEEEEDMDE